MELRNVRTARERVLQDLWLNAGATERTVPIAGDLQDLAADLGLTRESFYRTLAGLEAEGGVARTDQGIVLKASGKAAGHITGQVLSVSGGYSMAG